MTAAIEVKNLQISFEKKRVLDDICLNIEKGSFCILIGANGSGKSSLIKALCGLQKYSGEIKFFGKLSSKINRNIIGYVPQNNVSHKNSPLSVYQAVSVGRYAKNGILKKFTDEDDKIVRNTIRLAGLESLSNSSLGDISGGEAQKVSMARVLAQQPEIVFLDEPQAGLDPAFQESFISFTEKLYSVFKFTCLMTTHEINMIPRCCTKVFMLKDGKIVCETDNCDIAKKAEKYKIY